MYTAIITPDFLARDLPESGLLLVRDDFTGYADIFEVLILSGWKMTGVDRMGEAQGTIWSKF